MPTSLIENFDSPYGEFSNYDTYDLTELSAVKQQRHVDIRSFLQHSVYEPFTMYDLDRYPLQGPPTMAHLDGMTMRQLEEYNLVIHGEEWTNGVVGPQSDYNNFNGITLSCTTGQNQTESIDDLIDVSAFKPTDQIILTLPSFPLGSIDLTQSYLVLSSTVPATNGTDTDWLDPAHTDVLSFSTANPQPTNGDCMAIWPRSALVNSQGLIRTVRFVIQATASCNFRALAIRCIPSTWQYAPLDQNTLHGYLGATVPLDAKLTDSYAFPWPILLRSDGAVGPSAVDMEVGVILEVGQGLHQNSFTFFFRELPITYVKMYQMDSMSMHQLEALGRQPDGTVGRIDDLAVTKYLSATINWGQDNSVHITDQTGNGYNFTGLTYAHPDTNPQSPSNAVTRYYALFSLKDESLRVQMYQCDLRGRVDWANIIFDSTAVIDSDLIRRRKGRFGWSAQLQDGDARVLQIRPRRVVYNEYRSSGFASRTPIDGVRLYVDSTPPKILNGAPLDNFRGTVGVRVTADTVKSNSGLSMRIDTDGSLPFQGIVSTIPLHFENIYDSEIKFSILAPNAARTLALIRGEGRFITHELPVVYPINQWTDVTIQIGNLADRFTPGDYRLYIVQQPTVANTFYIDNLRAQTRSVVWSVRTEEDQDWLDCEDNLNDPFASVLLRRGRNFQMRGEVVTETGEITKVHALPRYASLGKFIWSDQIGSVPTPPSPLSFTTQTLSTSERRVSFTTNSTATVYWNFGDGTNGVGDTTQHQFTAHGTYQVTVIVCDSYGQKTAATQAVTI